MAIERYTRHEIVKKCRDALQKVETFYQADFINYRGETSDTRELYSEVICEFICSNIAVFQNNIPRISRKSSYKVSSHLGQYSTISNREEEITAMKLFNQSKNGYSFDHIGKIIDYQTPLRSQKRDSAGKVDLLAYNGKELRFLELKKKNSMETMLRCVIEGYTYLRTADTAKMLSDFNLPADTIVKASPFVFKGQAQQLEMEEDRPQLKRLMILLDSKPFYLKEQNNFYTVED